MQYVLPWPAHLIANILYSDYAEDFILYPNIYLERWGLLPIFYIIIMEKAPLSDTYPFSFYLRFAD